MFILGAGRYLWESGSDKRNKREELITIWDKERYWDGVEGLLK